MKTSLLKSVAALGVVSAMIATPLVAQTPLSDWLEGAPHNGMVVDQERGVLTMAPLIERATPAVVNIRVVSRKSSSTMDIEDLPPSLRRMIPENWRGQGRPRSAVSAGSGVIVNAGQGFILTNHHVVDGADEMVVTLKDGRSFDAEFIGSDSQSDLALLKIEATGLSDLQLADSDDVRVGDFVIAIGNPFGIGQTVTSGIVSGLDRYGLSRDAYEDFIQTDASINPGNSGGALINSKGELIAINTAIISRSGTSSGVGLAVPSNMATAVVDQLVRYGEVRRGRIGVGIQNLTPELAEGLGIDGTTKGALISTVSEDSPADKAGIEKGDVVVAFNGKPIESSRELRNAVGFVELGTTNKITYIRDGRRTTVSIGLEEIPGDETDADNEPREDSAEEFEPSSFRGAYLSAIPDEVDPVGGNDGVIITRVEAGSQAERAGLQRGDIIRGVNNQEIVDVYDFDDLVSENDGVVVLNVQRGRSEIFVAVKA